MKISLSNCLLPLLALLVIISSGCSKRVVHFSESALPLRIAVVADKDATSSDSLASAYRQVIQSISTNLVRQDIDVVNTGAVDQMGYEYDRTVGRTHHLENNLCKRYGTDAILMVHLEIIELRNLSDGNCRTSLSLDSWGYDSRGGDIGVSTSRTSVASNRSCEGALRTAAQDLGYKAAMVFSRRWAELNRQGTGKGVTVIETTGNDTGFD